MLKHCEKLFENVTCS